MKQIKNVTLAVLGGLLILSVATVSCKKKSSPASSAPTITGFTPATDSIGGTITITGTGFASPATVTINGVAATGVTVVSSTQITAVIPTGATSGTIIVTVNGQSGTSTTSITIGTLFSINGLTSSNQVEATSLIGYWPFDGSVTEATTSSNPTLSSGASTYSFVPGKIGQAIHLANGWLTYPASATTVGISNGGVSPNFNSDTLQNGFSISLWIQVPDTNYLTTAFALYTPNLGNYPIAGLLYHRYSPTDFAINGGVGSAQAPTVDYTDFNANGTYHFNDSLSWAHLVMVYDTTGHNLIYYANDIKVATISLAVSAGLNTAQPVLIPTPNYATIGTAGGQGTTPGNTSPIPTTYMANGLTGNIDDIRFYNKTLTAVPYATAA
jgi:hypothetical protein